MSLQTLLVNNFRIIEYLELSLARDATLFCGENGVGKTSILEAIDFLSRGRSFRSRRLEPLLRSGTETITVSGEVLVGNNIIHLGIQKSVKETSLHCNQQQVSSISNHANYLPIVSLHPESHQLVQGGARYRRNYIDWCAFHVKQEFLTDWRKYNKCLRQRNQILKQITNNSKELRAWTQELSDIGENIDYARYKTFSEISPYFKKFSSKLLPECKIAWDYKRGWDDKLPLSEALQQVAVRDLQLKTTQRGPHRAEINILLNDQGASMAASRGQQKLIAACLMLAQIEYVQAQKDLKCIVLLDDVRAELDQEHTEALFSSLQALKSQVMASAIEPEQVNLQGWDKTKVFHVKQGNCELIS